MLLAFRNIQVKEVWEQIKNADFSWLIGSMILALISHVFRALRWNQLIVQMNYKTSVTTTFYAVMVGYLANLALPRMGEVSRCVVLSRKEKIPFNALFGSVVAERVFDLVVLIFIVLSVLLVQMKEIGGFLNKVLIKPLLGNNTGNVMAIVIVVLSIIFLVIAFIIIFKKLKPWLKATSLYIKMEAFIDGFMGGLKSIAKVKNKGLFFIYTFIIWTLYLAMIILPFYSFEATSFLGIIDGVNILAIGSLGIIAPVPGGIGSYHFIITELFTQLYHIAPKDALAWATANHAAQTFLVLFAGSISYILLLLNKRKPLNEIADQTSTENFQE